MRHGIAYGAAGACEEAEIPLNMHLLANSDFAWANTYKIGAAVELHTLHCSPNGKIHTRERKHLRTVWRKYLIIAMAHSNFTLQGEGGMFRWANFSTQNFGAL